MEWSDAGYPSFLSGGRGARRGARGNLHHAGAKEDWCAALSDHYRPLRGHPPLKCKIIPYGVAPPPLTPPLKGEGDSLAVPQHADIRSFERNGDVSISLPLVERGQGWGYRAAEIDESFVCDNAPLKRGRN
jgi:hypothetical protein